MLRPVSVYYYLYDQMGGFYDSDFGVFEWCFWGHEKLFLMEEILLSSRLLTGVSCMARP